MSKTATAPMFKVAQVIEPAVKEAMGYTLPEDLLTTIRETDGWVAITEPDTTSRAKGCSARYGSEGFVFDSIDAGVDEDGNTLKQTRALYNPEVASLYQEIKDLNHRAKALLERAN